MVSWRELACMAENNVSERTEDRLRCTRQTELAVFAPSWMTFDDMSCHGNVKGLECIAAFGGDGNAASAKRPDWARNKRSEGRASTHAIPVYSKPVTAHTPMYCLCYFSL
jgi:hypothetical protein